MEVVVVRLFWYSLLPLWVLFTVVSKNRHLAYLYTYFLTIRLTIVPIPTTDAPHTASLEEHFMSFYSIKE